MEKSLDKDIEILKEILKDKEQIIRYHTWIGTKALDSIENVLPEFERYKQYYEEQNEVNKKFVSKDKFDEVNSDSETWKKIAEKLAERARDYGIISKCEKCFYEDSHECIQCIIDWAKREVLKDE